MISIISYCLLDTEAKYQLPFSSLFVSFYPLSKQRPSTFLINIYYESLLIKYNPVIGLRIQISSYKMRKFWGSSEQHSEYNLQCSVVYT